MRTVVLGWMQSGGYCENKAHASLTQRQTPNCHSQERVARALRITSRPSRTYTHTRASISTLALPWMVLVVVVVRLGACVATGARMCVPDAHNLHTHTTNRRTPPTQRTGGAPLNHHITLTPSPLLSMCTCAPLPHTTHSRGACTTTSNSRRTQPLVFRTHVCE